MDCHQHVFEQFRDAMGKLPKRILFYRSKWFRSCELRTQLTYVLPPALKTASPKKNTRLPSMKSFPASAVRLALPPSLTTV